jgi:hypothetical protein
MQPDDEPAEDTVGEFLALFARVIETMPTKDLEAFRDHWRQRSTGTEMHEELFQVIDGQLALRQLGVSPHC